MIGSSTRGWSASASEAITSPVPLLFIPSPNISATRRSRAARNSRARDHPAANIRTQRPTTIASVATRKSGSGRAIAWGAAFEIGPTGLVYVAMTDTLYVASTGDNAIYAISHAGKTMTDQGTGAVVYQDATHLHGPLGLALAPDGNFITSNGDVINSDPNQPSEPVEFTLKGKFVGQFSLNPAQGGAFGVATSPPSQHRFAAVNDITNSLQVWRVKT